MNNFSISVSLIILNSNRMQFCSNNIQHHSLAVCNHVQYPYNSPCNIQPQHSMWRSHHYMLQHRWTQRPSNSQQQYCHHSTLSSFDSHVLHGQDSDSTASKREPAELCTYCYCCSSTEHLPAGCRTRGARFQNRTALNGNRLPTRDREWPRQLNCPTNVQGNTWKIHSNTLSFLHKYIPEVKLKDIPEATEAPDGLQLVAANGTNMPYVGWVEITLKLTSFDESVKDLVIPVLVLQDQTLSKSGIGYSVIEQVMRQSEVNEKQWSE